MNFKKIILMTGLFLTIGFLNQASAQSTSWFDESKRDFCKAISKSVKESMAWASPSVQKKILKMLEECANEAYEDLEETGRASAAKKTWDYKYARLRDKVYRLYKVELPRRIS